MRVRARQTASVAAAMITAVGAALITHATIADNVETWRTGLATLVIGVAGVLVDRSCRNTRKLLAHQAEVARLSVAERWRYAEMGRKAARLDAIEGEEEPPEAGDAQVVNLHGACPSSVMRKNGSAS